MVWFASAWLAGCATVPTTSHGGALPAREPATPLPAAVQAVFDRASSTRAPLASSPWGNDVVVLLGETYPAASGRDCRAFTVQAGEQLQPGLACRRRADDEWAEVRVLQHHGRPVMGSAP